MKNIILIFLSFLLSNNANADCSGYGISIFPSNKSIKQNSIFMLEAYAHSREIINGLNSKYPIYLQSGDKIVKLIVGEKYDSQFQLKQVFLKPESTLESGLEYQLKIDNLPEYNELRRYNKETGEYEDIIYNIEDSKDIENPKLNSKPKKIDESYALFGCGPAMSVIFDLPISDQSEILIKTTFRSLKTKKETTYYIEPENDQIKVGHGMCSGAFTFSDGDNYEVEFSFMDASGNITSWTGDRIKFEKPSDEEWDAWRKEK
jgi:hypothetical protein